MVALEISLDLQLFLQEVGKLPVNVLDDGITAILFVDLVSESSCANHCQAQVHIALFELWSVWDTECTLVTCSC